MLLEINGLSVYYEQLGAGSDVVLLHGWGYASDLLVPLAKALASKHRVTLIDLPGHGKTAEPECPYYIEDFAAIVAGVCDKLNISKAHFLGHSNGGRTIITMSRNYSRLFDRLVLCDASGIRPRRGAGYYCRVYSYKLGKKLLSLPLFTQQQRDKFSRNKGSADYRMLSPVMKATFSNIVGEDLSSCLSGIKAPTLLIWGENDTDTPLYMAKQMESGIVDSALIIYAGKGHYAFVEDFNKTVAILDSFLV